ncbi:PREDICTED: sodium channel protein 60E-like, partial [Nicrophorus vespilloides]|uniref:Sodium channel protein 60E-like n=1 Tax=Nicrophorus vespilloides TaxID=110193 RepID=A0ABM1M9S2_NICVS
MQDMQMQVQELALVHSQMTQKLNNYKKMKYSIEIPRISEIAKNLVARLKCGSCISAPNRLGPHSRQTSSNSEGNRESSLDDSGVVDDHEDGYLTSEDTTQNPQRVEVTPVTLAVSPKEIKVIKCNGVGSCKKKKHNMYSLPADYLSHIVVIDDLPDRNCPGCERCCMDYTGWLQFQQMLYGIVRDPLFELAITVCIVLNTMFLAMEHHGMSENILRALDIGNK